MVINDAGRRPRVYAIIKYRSNFDRCNNDLGTGVGLLGISPYFEGNIGSANELRHSSASSFSTMNLSTPERTMSSFVKEW